MDKNVSLACGSAYRDYPYWFSPTKPGALPLDQIYRCPRQSRWFLCRWWRQSVCIISTRLVCNYVSPICHSHGVSSSMICCIPGGWGVCHVQMLRGQLVKWGVGVCHIFFWPAMNRNPLLQLSLWRTLKDVPQPLHLLWRLGGGHYNVRIRNNEIM